MTSDRTTDDIVTNSSGNVFADLNLPHSEEDMLKVRIAAAITDLIQRERLTQVQAGKRMGIDQPKVSALVRGRLDQFTVDRLLSFLLMLGLDVHVRISKEPREDRGRITVAA